ncbi:MULTISPECIES: hypothetical protein [Actibacterium]|uniref:Uncharacterized protein n=1 Tax=Actibacterium naphthalenivorans TaxID=1614693 RepID=A0A840CDJ1_9RHOB|nr:MULTISPECIES: hypothetical protein [Actibacterium]ALG90906.1 hypothetical protein TQ29_12865 [Actibacterium sp. EMB200-NS6]MBB4023270.1 hypothetical protein [Actibacterium naphthalenivorans]
MSEGLFALLPDGGVMVEEENFGCLLITDRDDNVKARFINRAENGEVYRLGGSRVIAPCPANRTSSPCIIFQAHPEK